MFVFLHGWQNTSFPPLNTNTNVLSKKMRVLFRLRPKSTVIYCRIKVDGVYANDFSTFIKLENRDEWDSERQRIKGRSQRVCDDNTRLGIISSELMQLHIANPEFSAQHLANVYTRKQKINYSALEIIRMFEERCEEMYGNEETLGTYARRIANIRRFLEEKSLDKIMADRITLGMADDFVSWMKGQQYDHQYIVRHVQVLKNITEMATRKEILLRDPLASFKLKRKEKIDTSHLTRQEVFTLESTTWTDNMQKVVDLFLFSVYTGLHFKDAQTVKSSEIGTGIDGRLWLFKPRGKYEKSTFFNGKEMVQTVPLHTKALLLIEKYGSVENLPKINNVEFNASLKQIKFMAGIQVKRMTVSVARKTFTDIMLNELNVSTDTVSTMLGHKTTRHVKHYARADERRIAKEMSKVEW